MMTLPDSKQLVLKKKSIFLAHITHFKKIHNLTSITLPVVNADGAVCEHSTPHNSRDKSSLLIAPKSINSPIDKASAGYWDMLNVDFHTQHCVVCTQT